MCVIIQLSSGAYTLSWKTIQQHSPYLSLNSTFPNQAFLFCEWKTLNFSQIEMQFILLILRQFKYLYHYILYY